MFKKIACGCFLFILLLVGLGVYWVSGLPSEMNVVSTREIAASSETIHPMVEDLRRWPEWSYWDEIEPEMTKTRTFEGSEKGEGAIARWLSTSGPGSMTVTASDPMKGLWYDLSFGNPGAEMISKGAITYEAQDDSTLVKFEMRGDLDGMVARLMGYWMSSVVEDSFEANLANLAELAEAK